MGKNRTTVANADRIRRLEAENAFLKQQLHEWAERQPWNRVAATFGALPRLIEALGDLAFAADPLGSKPIDGKPVGRGSVDLSPGLSANGHTMKGAEGSTAARSAVEHFDQELGRLAAQIVSASRRTGRVPAAAKTKRRCRRVDCPDEGKRQYGMWQAGEYLCRSCRHPLPG